MEEGEKEGRKRSDLARREIGEECYEVGPSEHRLYAQDALELWLPEIHRPALRRLLRDGKVLRNGMPLEPRERVREGDLLSFVEEVDLAELPRFQKKDKRTPLDKPEVLFEDESCLVLQKPSGLGSVPDRIGDTSVHQRLGAWFGEEADLRIVHRLDKGTSGALILAKGREAAKAFDLAFREKRIHKSYLALVRGIPHLDVFSCKERIGRTLRGGKVRTGPGKGSREAHTDFRVLDRFRGFALLEARPRTGRMHQIRVHLLRLGLPLAVEPLYTKAKGLYLHEFKKDYRKRPSHEEKPLIARLSLHAVYLRFVSPASGEEVQVIAEPPKDFRVVLAKLNKFACIPGERAAKPSYCFEDEDAAFRPEGGTESGMEGGTEDGA
ncbi:MAG TPA: RluA family pseudouridine synthase [Planctomycetes bacterium]|nr:RluA family pseudouridine synthase [Planctomycetota bacterium]